MTPPFFFKLKSSLKDPYFFIVLTKWPHIFLLSSLKDPLFSLVCHRKTPTLGVVSPSLVTPPPVFICQWTNAQRSTVNVSAFWEEMACLSEIYSWKAKLNLLVNWMNILLELNIGTVGHPICIYFCGLKMPQQYTKVLFVTWLLIQCWRSDLRLADTGVKNLLRHE